MIKHFIFKVICQNLVVLCFTEKYNVTIGVVSIYFFMFHLFFGCFVVYSNKNCLKYLIESLSLW